MLRWPSFCLRSVIKLILVGLSYIQTLRGYLVMGIPYMVVCLFVHLYMFVTSCAQYKHEAQSLVIHSWSQHLENLTILTITCTTGQNEIVVFFGWAWPSSFTPCFQIFILVLYPLLMLVSPICRGSGWMIWWSMSPQWFAVVTVYTSLVVMHSTRLLTHSQCILYLTLEESKTSVCIELILTIMCTTGRNEIVVFSDEHDHRASRHVFRFSFWCYIHC